MLGWGSIPIEATTSHNGAILDVQTSTNGRKCLMPSLFRFLFVLGMLLGATYASLYVLAVYFEPSQKEVQKPLASITIRR